MKPTVCPSCGEGNLTPAKKRLPFTYKGETYWIPGVKVARCDRCGEEILTAEEIRQMEKIARERMESQFTGKFILRIPPELHQKLSEEANKNRRSLNQEVASRLEASLKTAL